MGDAKTTLQCLGNCDASFDIACLQKALKPDMFSKWFRKIQMAEIGEVIALSYQINTHFPGNIYTCSCVLYFPYHSNPFYQLGWPSRPRRMSILSIYYYYGYYARRE